MNTHDESGDQGNFVDLVTHEFGHLLGLDGYDTKHTKTQKAAYYPGKGGIMEYKGTKLSPISDKDVQTILKYAEDVIFGDKKEATGANVKVLSVTGTGKKDNTTPDTQKK